MSIHSNIDKIKARITVAISESLLSNRMVNIIAASKDQPQYKIEEAINSGIINFGENRVQEAQEKWQELKVKYDNVKLHLIGNLQSNKVKQALLLFDVIETIDRKSLIEEIVKLRDGGFNIDNKKFYVQVNTGKEAQKSGVYPEDVDLFIDFCTERGVKIDGLMCIPPVEQPPAPHFALLREISLRNGLLELSMGMSKDFEEAIRMGATSIRLGTVLFGGRN
ncbi:MAG: YggS family pyridoxal phosphate-dependent enzyme [Rickettsiales bacterium]